MLAMKAVPPGVDKVRTFQWVYAQDTFGKHVLPETIDVVSVCSLRGELLIDGKFADVAPRLRMSAVTGLMILTPFVADP